MGRRFALAHPTRYPPIYNEKCYRYFIALDQGRLNLLLDIPAQHNELRRD